MSLDVKTSFVLVSHQCCRPIQSQHIALDEIFQVTESP